MSNIFLKTDLDGIFNATTESNISLPKWINIIDDLVNNKYNNKKYSSIENKTPKLVYNNKITNYISLLVKVSRIQSLAVRVLNK